MHHLFSQAHPHIPVMEAIVEVHAYIMFFLVAIVIFGLVFQVRTESTPEGTPPGGGPRDPRDPRKPPTPEVVPWYTRRDVIAGILVGTALVALVGILWWNGKFEKWDWNMPLQNLFQSLSTWSTKRATELVSEVVTPAECVEWLKLAGLNVGPQGLDDLVEEVIHYTKEALPQDVLPDTVGTIFQLVASGADPESAQKVLEEGLKSLIRKSARQICCRIARDALDFGSGSSEDSDSD